VKAEGKMADKIPFQGSGTDSKQENSNTQMEHFKGIEAFRRVTNSLAAQQQRKMTPEAKVSKDSGWAGDNSPQHNVTRRKKSNDGESGSPFQQSNPFAIANTSTVMVPDEPAKVAVSSLAVKRSEVEAPKSIPDIKRKGGLSEQSELLASFISSASAESAAATNPFLQKTVGGTDGSDNPFSKSKKSLSKPIATPKSTRVKASTIKPPKATQNSDSGDMYWLVPVESLGSGIASALGDAVGGIVNAGQSLGGKRKKRKTSKKSTPRPNPTVNNPGKPVKYKQSSGSIMSGTVSGGFKNILFGAGQIVKGGTGIVKGGAGIVVGSLGCLGGAIVCMTGTVKEPTVANTNKQ
jgi:hypothetical protein